MTTRQKVCTLLRHSILTSYGSGFTTSDKDLRKQPQENMNIKLTENQPKPLTLNNLLSGYFLKKIAENFFILTTYKGKKSTNIINPIIENNILVHVARLSEQPLQHHEICLIATEYRWIPCLSRSTKSAIRNILHKNKFTILPT